ncbi:MAG: hypothetical protein GXY68_13450 [Chloroflexi bacterium]|nr:hypothetical protein [Chloroflexota bacterium]
MIAALIWWLVIDVIALAALPVTCRLLRHLPTRGVMLSRHVGLVLASYLFWLLPSLHVAEIGAPLAWAATSTVAVISLIAGWRHRADLWRELQAARTVWLAGELVFAAAYVGFAVFRAYNPDIAATEKPMEMAFINGILRSRHFPPQDPWLSGYGISYYYGGYVASAMLTLATGLRSAITFNLTNVTLFALTALGAYGLLADLVLAHAGEQGGPRATARAIGTGVLGAVLVAAMGNLEGVFELLRAHGGGSEALWRWLDVRNLGATAHSAHWYPDDGWWWWRASRIIHDRDLAGNAMEVISEFPFFSFLLGDNHPHVYALPLGLLALALSLNALRAVRAHSTQQLSGSLGLPGVTLLDLLAWALLLGALGFYNTWDLPVHLALFCGAVALGLWSQRASAWDWFVRVCGLGLSLLVGGLLLYLPFYWGLRSQAGGLGAVTVKTQVQQYGLMFAALLWPLLGAVLADGGQRRSRPTPVGWALVLALGGLAGAAALVGWWTACLGLALASLAAWRLLSRETLDAPESDAFVWLMMGLGVVLTVAVEFVYLRDVFDTRMNTVFKFYYQAWLLLGVAAAYACYRLATLSAAGIWRVLRGAWLGVTGLLLLAGLSYTVAATVSKANGFAGQPTLDGQRYLAEYRPQAYEAMRWLDTHAGPGAVMVEASGGSYSEDNWVSAHTGIATLLGWGGHELQWRGDYAQVAQREPVVASFYQSADPLELRALAAEWRVDYVWLGPTERTRYNVTPLAERALDQAFERLYENDTVVIYGTTRGRFGPQASGRVSTSRAIMGTRSPATITQKTPL